jgi:hypothetical protein
MIESGRFYKRAFEELAGDGYIFQLAAVISALAASLLDVEQV